MHTSYSSFHSKLQQAKDYVVAGWVPLSSERIDAIRARLLKPADANNVDSLLVDLQSDVALFTYFLRRLGEVVTPEESKMIPSELLHRIEITRLAKIFEVPAAGLSAHSLENAAELQLLRLQHTIVSTTSAVALANGKNVDPEWTFLAAAVRELGLNLVAWNYPRIYTRAVASLSVSDGDLDQALQRVLGYSPLRLGFEVALGWCSNSQLRKAIGLDAIKLESGEDTASRDILGCCRLAEQLADLTDQEHHPGAVRHADSVFKEVSLILGTSGLETLKELCESQIASYPALSRSNRTTFDSTSFSPAALNRQYGLRRMKENTFIDKCDQEVVDKFRSVYAALEHGVVSERALNILVSEVTPFLGFSQGCLYLINNRDRVAVPMLRLGRALLEQFRPVSLTSYKDHNHPVVMSLTHHAPLVRDRTVIASADVSSITWRLDLGIRGGVLYLEMGPHLKYIDRQTTVLYFKAIACSLRHALDGGVEAPNVQ